MKNKQLNTWFWRWHIISALITLPVVIIITVTGIIYLYKVDVNDWIYKEQRFVSDVPESKPYSFQQQLNKANQFVEGRYVNRLFLSNDVNKATTFYLAAKGHARHAVYVNPYTLEVQGDYVQKDSLMYLVRKLHGELLLGLPGTLLVELVACWLIVMLLTGLYMWWPQKSWRALGFFWIRTKDGSRILWRDLHVTLGFYSCVVIFIILLGGLPWTEVFGSAYKNIQQKTQTGYPEGWRKVTVGSHDGEPLNLD